MNSPLRRGFKASLLMLRSVEQANDAVQEGVLNFLKHPKYATLPEVEQSKILYTCINNAAVDIIRKNARSPQSTHSESDDTVLLNVPQSSHSPLLMAHLDAIKCDVSRTLGADGDAVLYSWLCAACDCISAKRHINVSRYHLELFLVQNFPNTKPAQSADTLTRLAKSIEAIFYRHGVDPEDFRILHRNRTSP